MNEFKAHGLEALNIATSLLQRARLADPTGGLFEAADVQWWWAVPRRSDEVDKLFWMDEHGPVAGVLLTSWSDDDWQCDPILVRGAEGPDRRDIWRQALIHAAKHAGNGFTVPVRDDDAEFRELAEQAGFTPAHRDRTAWMESSEQPEISALPEDFAIVDRGQRSRSPHPMRKRNGEDVAERLRQCSLYDPELDLAVEASDVQNAGYSLYWFDPVTKVGLVEPVRVEDEFQRRGLARAMLTTGIDRLVKKGAQRISISYETDAAAALYLSTGFREMSSATWFRAPGAKGGE